MKTIVTLLILLATAVFAQQKGSFTDPRDKKTYKTVKIGEQVWMAQNLNYHGADGFLGLCYGDEPAKKIKKTDNCNKYGRLYDWNEAMKACPNGWNLPSDEEWQTLVDFVGGYEVAGKKLKSKSGWPVHDFSETSPKVPKCKWSERTKEEIDNRGRVIKPAGVIEHDKCTTDEYGFSALPGGYGVYYGDYGGTVRFVSVGNDGGWWSASVDGYGRRAYSRDMSYSLGSVLRGGNPSYGGVSHSSYGRRDINDLFSVRCFRDGEAKEIKITQDVISVDGRTVVETATVAEQDGLVIEALKNALQNKSRSANIQIDQNINYNIFSKVIATVSASGYIDINYASEVNGKNHIENINFQGGNNSSESSDNNLNLTVAISQEYLEIWARGGSLPKVFHKECHDGKTLNLCALHKESEEDPGKILMSVYSKRDSAYIDSNNEFIEEINLIQPGATVATLSKYSSRKLACGQTAPGVEDICTNGKLAVTLRPRSAYDELAKTLIAIHNRFIDSPDAKEIRIVADYDIEISKVLKVHHEAKTAGFTKIKFATLTAKTSKSNYSAYELMKDPNFAKDIDKVLSKVGGLQSSGKTELGDRRGSARGSSNDDYEEAGSGDIGTKVSGGVKAPSARDVDMGSGDGSRSKAEIMAVTNARMPGLRNIYNKYLKLKPDFSGKVTLKFTIAPGGDIVSISIVSSTTGYSEFDNAIKAMVATWKWKAIESGNTTPTIPFRFEE